MLEDHRFLLGELELGRVADGCFAIEPSRLGKRSELFEHIVDALDECRAIAEKSVAALRHSAVDSTGDGEDFPVLFAGKSSGDQGSTSFGRLDDDHAERQSGHDSVALGKGTALGRLVGMQFGDDGALSDNFSGKAFVFGRVDVEQAAAEHGDRPSTRLERTAVGGGVDTSGESGDDREPGQRQPSPQLFANFFAVVGGVPRTDDRNRNRVGWFDFPESEKQAGRIVDFLERRRIVGVLPVDDLDLILFARFEELSKAIRVFGLTDFSAKFAADSRHLSQLSFAGMQNIGGRTERVEQLSKNSGAHSGDKTEANRSEALIAKINLLC